jgi:signal transduction histidine kinase
MSWSHSHELNDTFDTSYTDDESLRESLNHLKEVNKKLITKYNNQREFVSLAAHELRSPIMPILEILELLEYEFEESDKKEIKLQREHFERLARNTRRLERLASEILDVTKIDDQPLRLN